MASLSIAMKVGVFALLLLMAAGCSREAPEVDLASDPIAVALVQGAKGSELVVVDLQRFGVVRRIPLRSLCLSIDGDRRSRTVVTAQCGGPDRACDDAVGIWSPSDGAKVTYVSLGVPNPSSVAVLYGRALVVHGFEQAQGACAATIDLVERGLEARWHLPPSVLRPEVAAKAIVIPLARTDAGPGGLRLMDGASEASPLTPLEARTVTVVEDAAAVPGSAVWAVYEEAGDGSVWRIAAAQAAAHDDSAAGAPVKTAPLPGVRKGVYEACRVGDVLALADADSMDLSDPGRDVLLVDSGTLEQRGRIRVDGTPSALRSWGHRLLVVDGLLGELLLFEPGAKKPARRLSLGGPQLGTGDLTVFY